MKNLVENGAIAGLAKISKCMKSGKYRQVEFEGKCFFGNKPEYQ